MIIIYAILVLTVFTITIVSSFQEDEDLPRSL